MATLIKSVDDIKKYVSVNKNIAWESIQPYITQADRKYIKPLIGDLIYDDYAETEPTGTELKVYKLLCEASSNLAWFIYLPLASVNVGDNGISVSSGEHYQAADWRQLNDLRRSLLDAGFQALDEALKIMEANEDDFLPWPETEGYTIFKELFVKRTDTFNRWFNIGNSRRTFTALRSYMLEVYHQNFASLFNTETLTLINNADSESAEAVQLALEYLQAAQVSFTVSKAVDSGSFLLTESGMYQKQEDFPGYKMNPLNAMQLNSLKMDRLVAADEYLKKAFEVIEANLTDFPNYETKAAITFISPKNTKSIVSF